MIKEFEFEGKTIEDAINAGVEKLGIERENANYDIVSTPKSGFLGIGSKAAVIKARIKEETPETVKEDVRWLVIHCTATREDRDYTALQLLNDHRLRGFRTVGYHLYIRRNGVVTQHRPLLEVGAHCRPYNRCSIGICYEGGLDPQGRPKDTRTPQQKEQLLSLLVRLKQLFPQARVRGHCEMRGATPKACPCFLPSAEYAHLDKNLG